MFHSVFGFSSLERFTFYSKFPGSGSSQSAGPRIERCKYFYSAVGSFSHHSTESILIHLQRVTQAKLYYFKRRNHVNRPMFSMLFGCSQYRCSHTPTCLEVKFNMGMLTARRRMTTIPSFRPIFLSSCLLPSGRWLSRSCT